MQTDPTGELLNHQTYLSRKSRDYFPFGHVQCCWVLVIIDGRYKGLVHTLHCLEFSY